MKRPYLVRCCFFILIALFTSSCGVASGGTLTLNELRHWLSGFVQPQSNSLIRVVSADQGEMQIHFSKQALTIILDQGNGVDIQGVTITVVDLGGRYLVETADPRQRYLPSAQIVTCQEQEGCRIPAPQMSNEYIWNMLPLGAIPAQSLMESYYGTSTIQDLPRFLSTKTAARSINLLIHSNGMNSLDQQVRVYKTPASLTYFVLTTQQYTQLMSSQSETNSIPLNVMSTALDFLPGLRTNMVSMQPPAAMTLPSPVPENLPTNTPSTAPPSDSPTQENPPATADPTPATIQQTPTESSPIQTDNWLNEIPDEWLDDLASEWVPDESQLFEPPIPAAWQTDAFAPAEENLLAPSYSSTFPAVPPVILGQCPAAVHDRFHITGPDGQTYRSWHPVTVPLNPADPNGSTCSFAHEHGDPPHPDAPQPAFGFAALHANLNQQILDHSGYKVFTHIAGGQTGWGTPESNTLEPDWDMMIWVHMGTASHDRLFERYHEIAFWSRDSQDRITEIHVLADTGQAADICTSTVHPGRHLASSCNPQYEIWDYVVNMQSWQAQFSVAVLNPMTHIQSGSPDITSAHLQSTSEILCGQGPEACDQKLSFGASDSFWLGNRRLLIPQNWSWQNAEGSFFSCSDPFGTPVSDELCTLSTFGFILQREGLGQQTINDASIWDRSATGVPDAFPNQLPAGAPGGN